MNLKTTFLKSKRILQNEGISAFTYKALKKLKNLGQNRYEIWMKKNESQSREELNQELKQLSFQPKVSIVTAVYNPELEHLVSAVESVKNQIYENWELCLADASDKEEIRSYLKNLEKEDKRFKVKLLPKNISIAGNTNEAINLATGEYLAFMDHDDTLAEFALLEVAKALNRDKNLDLIYSDEDKLSLSGKRIDPHFKPDWDPDLLNSFNYITHLVVARAELIREVGQLREGFEGAQDYDLILRITERTEKIAHIAKILYHWRLSRTSTAYDISTKNYAIESGKKALEAHLERLKIPGSVETTKYPCLYRIRYEISGEPKISIIVPTKDNSNYLKKCIESILSKSTYKNYEILIIDNASKETEAIAYLKELKNNHQIKILEFNEEFNFSKLNNFAAKQARGEYLVLLNNDTEVISPDWLESMLEQAQRDEVGVVGAKLYYPDQTVQHAGVILGMGDGFAGHAFALQPKYSTGYYTRLVAVQNYLAVTAACLMVKTSIYHEVGGFDENLQVAFNDVDFCLKVVEKDYRVVWTPYAELYHKESQTRGYDRNESQKKKFEEESVYSEKKWHKFFSKGDPYFNPNLTLKNTEFFINID